MLVVRDDPDPTLHALLSPLLYLDRELQHALYLENSLRELEDQLDDAPVPHCLPLLQICIQSIQTMVREMRIYRLLLLFRLQRALTLSGHQFGRAPLIDLELG